jgi:hypothetical protein
MFLLGQHKRTTDNSLCKVMLPMFMCRGGGRKGVGVLQIYSRTLAPSTPVSIE